MRASNGCHALPPTRRVWRASRARSSLGCRSAGSSPTSSRNSVPPCACSKTPARSRSAPVNAPRTNPNSSDSTSVGATELQSNTTKGPCLHRLASWMPRASSSLPVPDSPTSKTVSWVAAATCSLANSARIASVPPTASPKRAPVESGSSRGAPVTRTASRHAPTRTTRPGRRTASWISTSPTNVPFLLPRSRSTIPASPRAMAQWRRETCASSTTRSHSRLVPTTIGSMPSGTSVSAPDGAVAQTSIDGIETALFRIHVIVYVGS